MRLNDRLMRGPFVRCADDHALTGVAVELVVQALAFDAAVYYHAAGLLGRKEILKESLGLAELLLPTTVDVAEFWIHRV